MPRVTLSTVADRAADAFEPTDQRRIGAEVEWLVYDRDEPMRCIDAATTAATSRGVLPGGGRITVEPGGQLELVTAPHDGPTALIRAIDADTRVLVERFAARGLVLVPLGLDPVREARRTVDEPRYVAMERHFRQHSPAGVEMMCRTASLQLNVDVGPDAGASWATAHRAAPVLMAAFANSPTADGSACRPVSHRQQIWAATDPTRTRPVGASPADWMRYVLDARPMMRAGGEAPPLGFATFGAWVDSATPPTSADFDLHLTTLFPPLRPRGFLEFRMIDALPHDGRLAAIATVWALLTVTEVQRELTDIVGSFDVWWERSLADGLDDASVHDAATRLLAKVEHTCGDADLREACARWQQRLRLAPATMIDVVGLAEPAR